MLFVYSIGVFFVYSLYKGCAPLCFLYNIHITYQNKKKMCFGAFYHMLKFSGVMFGFSQAFATLEMGIRKMTLSLFFFSKSLVC